MPVTVAAPLVQDVRRLGRLCRPVRGSTKRRGQAAGDGLPAFSAFTDGAYVRAGQVLFTIDARPNRRRSIKALPSLPALKRHWSTREPNWPGRKLLPSQAASTEKLSSAEPGSGRRRRREQTRARFARSS